MSIPTTAGFDLVIKPIIFELARKIGEEPRESCEVCGAWFISSRDHHDEKRCVECSGSFESWNKEKNRERQREYAYKRVSVDRRRKENKHENVCNAT